MLDVRPVRGVLAVVLMAAALVTSAPVLTAPAGAVSGNEATVAGDLLGFANRERVARGLPALQLDDHATGKAQEWAEYMRSRNTLSHRSDFKSSFSGYSAAGENVGETEGTAGELHRMWMGSSEHRRNLLQPGFDAAGVGVACAGDGRMWVVLDAVARDSSTANRFSSATPATSPQTVADAGSRCAEPTASAATVGAPGSGGYWLVARDGGIFSFGDVGFLGSTGGMRLNQPIVTMAPTSTRKGYWLFARDGGIFNYGDAGFAGAMGGGPLVAPIVAAAARGTNGYWMAAADGGVFNFGTAPFAGAMGGHRLNAPIVGMAATRSGNGYWLVASDGGIFAFGDARFYGSTGGQRLNQPIVAMAATPSGNGYWLVARDGGIFAYGDAGFYGSTGGRPLNRPVVTMTRTPSGGGYWLVASDGGVFNFGNAAYRGSTGGVYLNQPVVGGAA
ncbi:MAG: hypothetical protein QOI20_1384 [Acidimicrobiaceae bacterium]|jgi:hypothetical protein|nr:hypothetical protein [Acidimicrobiaceae bacterium]